MGSVARSLVKMTLAWARDPILRRVGIASARPSQIVPMATDIPCIGQPDLDEDVEKAHGTDQERGT